MRPRDVRQDAALSARDRRMVDLIAAGGTQLNTAKVLGCHRTTVQRALNRPEVQRALRLALDDMRASLVRRLTAEGIQAVARLGERARDPDLSPGERAVADARLATLAVQTLPKEIDATATVTVVEPAADAKAELFDALDRARGRLGIVPALVSGNGSNGDGG